MRVEPRRLVADVGPFGPRGRKTRALILAKVKESAPDAETSLGIVLLGRNPDDPVRLVRLMFVEG